MAYSTISGKATGGPARKDAGPVRQPGIALL
jgi:hypothetical protein